MKTLLVSNNYTGKPESIIRQIVGDEFSLFFLEDNTSKCLIDSVDKADYLLASGRIQIDAEVLNKAEHLKMIQRTGSGLDSLDLEEIQNRGIPVYVNAGINAQSVAEYTLMLMLGCLRRVVIVDKNTKNGIWKKQEQGIETEELYGKTVGLIGFGNIGKKVAGMLVPFNTNTLYYNSSGKDGDYDIEHHAHYADLNELLRKSDIVSIHCPLTSNTRNMISEQEIEKMKEGAILINTARGGIVDTNALVDALIKRKLSFAGIDVYDKEPLASNSGLRLLDNVILSPHIAGVTKESFTNMISAAIRNIRLFDNGQMEEIERYRII